MIKELPLTLEALGFGNKEATVYVALLELGRGTVTQIAVRLVSTEQPDTTSWTHS